MYDFWLHFYGITGLVDTRLLSTIFVPVASHVMIHIPSAHQLEIPKLFCSCSHQVGIDFINPRSCVTRSQSELSKKIAEISASELAHGRPTVVTSSHNNNHYNMSREEGEVLGITLLTLKSLSESCIGLPNLHVNLVITIMQF